MVFWPLEAIVLRDPHLVLTDIAADEGLFGLGSAEIPQQTRRVHEARRRVVSPRVFYFGNAAFFSPTVDVEQLDSVEERTQRVVQITDQGDIWVPSLTEFGGVDVQMNHPRFGRELLEQPCDSIVEPRTHTDQEVTSLHRVVG